MKNFICLTAIVSTVLLTAGTVKAQGYPYGGSSTTTIYVPPIENPTTQVAPTNIYPSNNSFGTTMPTTYGGSYPTRRHRQIIQQRNLYPRAIQSSCSTSIIGSPIPSPVALDRSGQPCR